MHERSLVRCLLRLIEEQMEAQPFESLRAVHVSVGEFSGVEGPLLEIAFQEAMYQRGNLHVQLLVTAVPLRARCVGCDQVFEVKAFEFSCPRCEHQRVTIVSGEEFTLDRLEVEA